MAMTLARKIARRVRSYLPRKQGQHLAIEDKLMTLTTDQVRWAYRILLNREPESEIVVAAQALHYGSLSAIRKAFADSTDFKALVELPKTQGLMPFLLPQAVNGEIHIPIPTLEHPVSQMCTEWQMRETHFRSFCTSVGLDPEVMHRKYWEWAYIYRVLQLEGMIQPGRRGLVFAVGEEPLPALMAAQGVDVLATDGPSDVADLWNTSNQYASELKNLWKEDVISWDDMQARVKFEVADMRAIPAKLRDFDFVWSSCSLEHLGGLRQGMDFVKESIKCLRPGGIAVHTTEFNLSSNDDTVDSFPTCIYRRRDFETLAAELRDDGHDVVPFNFFPGNEPLDIHIDYPPHAPPHLRLALMNYVSTSAGIITRKKK